MDGMVGVELGVMRFLASWSTLTPRLSLALLLFGRPGLYSDVDTNVVGAVMTGNVAAESGGGATFQPSPCQTAVVRVSGSTLVDNHGIALRGCCETCETGTVPSHSPI